MDEPDEGRGGGANAGGPERETGGECFGEVVSSSSSMIGEAEGPRRSVDDEYERGIGGIGGTARLPLLACPLRLYSLLLRRGTSAPASSRPAEDPDPLLPKSPDLLLLGLSSPGLAGEGDVEPGLGLVIF